MVRMSDQPYYSRACTYQFAQAKLTWMDPEARVKEVVVFGDVDMGRGDV